MPGRNLGWIPEERASFRDRNHLGYLPCRSLELLPRISRLYKKRSDPVSAGSQRRKFPPKEAQPLRQLPERNPWWPPGRRETCQRQKPVSGLRAWKPLRCLQGREGRGWAVLVSPGATAAPGSQAASLAPMLRNSRPPVLGSGRSFFPRADWHRSRGFFRLPLQH